MQQKSLIKLFYSKKTFRNLLEKELFTETNHNFIIILRNSDIQKHIQKLLSATFVKSYNKNI